MSLQVECENQVSGHLVTEYQADSVDGIVMYDGNLVVVHGGNETIYVYNHALRQIGKMTVPGMVHPGYMVPDTSNNVLVISDWEKMLHWVSMSSVDGELVLSVKTTLVMFSPLGMHMTHNGELLVCHSVRQRVYRYRDGKSRGHIQLKNITPYDVSSNGKGLVISDSIHKQVVWVKDDGDTLFAVNHATSPFLKMGVPHALVHDSEGQVLVADFNSHQVLVFDQNGEGAGQLLGKSDGIYQPGRLLLDQRNDTLYVTCMGPVRVMLFTYTSLLSICGNR